MGFGYFLIIFIFLIYEMATHFCMVTFLSTFLSCMELGGQGILSVKCSTRDMSHLMICPTWWYVPGTWPTWGHAIQPPSHLCNISDMFLKNSINAMKQIKKMKEKITPDHFSSVLVIQKNIQLCVQSLNAVACECCLCCCTW